jgi:glycosyltransferase involved in cell wall biosynthesis
MVKKILKLFKSGYLSSKIRLQNLQREEQKLIEEFAKNNFLTDKEREKIRREIAEFSYKPLISIVMPVYEVDEKWLRLCIESVCQQIYENWEFCIADDFSQSPHIKKVLEEYQANDSRFKIIFRTENGHISRASNSALSLAKGEFVALLDNDDELSEIALFEVVKELNKFPNAQFLYSDEISINENGECIDYVPKPNWNVDLFYSMNFLNHLSVYRREILEKIGGFRIGFEGSQDYDLALRFIEQISHENIRHIPKVLYHWRAISGSIALNPNEKSYAHERARDALREHFQRKNEKVEIAEGFQNYHRILPIFDKEISFEMFELSEFEKAKTSQSDVLIFVGKGMKPLSNQAFSEIANHAMRKEIGAVGGIIFNQNETINNCGIIGGKVINEGLPKGYFGKLAIGKVLQSVDAVTDVLAIRRELFDTDFPQDFVGICEILRQKKYRILFTPYAEFAKSVL